MHFSILLRAQDFCNLKISMCILTVTERHYQNGNKRDTNCLSTVTLEIIIANFDLDVIVTLISGLYRGES